MNVHTLHVLACSCGVMCSMHVPRDLVLRLCQDLCNCWKMDFHCIERVCMAMTFESAAEITIFHFVISLLSGKYNSFEHVEHLFTCIAKSSGRLTS